MGATYDDALPTDRDRARSILGDTQDLPDDALLTDEHIDAVLAWQASLDGAVAFLAAELAARFARQPVRVTSNGKTVDYGERLAHWRTIAGEARADAAGGGLTMVPATYTDTATTDEFARPPDYWP